MTIQFLLSLDFGSEYIRVAKTRYDTALPAILNPQLVEFNGRSELRNAILLNPDMQGWQEIGEDALTNSAFYENPNLTLRSLALDSDPISEMGKPVDFFLQHITTTAGLRKLTAEALSDWQTLVALPTLSAKGAAMRWLARLQQAGLPAPQVLDASAAALAAHDLVSHPGMYLVVDLGAGYARAAVCEISDALEFRLRSAKSGSPGGRDFDQALLQHFSQRLTRATIESPGGQLELNHFVEQFKRQFANAWAEGQDSFQTLYPVPSVLEVLELRPADFESTALAGELIKAFRSVVRRALDEGGLSTGNLDGIVLCGGGAHWPFVKTWAAEVLEPGKIHCGDFPEQTVVRGLPSLAATNIKTVSSAPVQPGHAAPTPGAQAPAMPATPPVPSLPMPSPKKAFWVEFIGGLVGVLGLGWFFVLKNFVGCALLLGWWAVLALALAISGGLSVATVNPLILIIVIPVWLLGPLASAIVAYRSAKKRVKESGKQ